MVRIVVVAVIVLAAAGTCLAGEIETTFAQKLNRLDPQFDTLRWWS